MRLVFNAILHSVGAFVWWMFGGFRKPFSQMLGTELNDFRNVITGFFTILLLTALILILQLK